MLVCLLALFLVYTQAQLPGIEATITTVGLEYARQEGMAIVQKEVGALKIPNAEGQAGTPIGKVTWQVTDITLTSLSLPSSSIGVNPGNQEIGVQFVLDMGLHCNFHYRENSWPHISGGGNADISLSGSTIAVAMSLVDVSGSPQIVVRGVGVNLAGFHISLHGGASWFYNILLDLFKGQVKNDIQNGIQSAISNLFSNQLNAILRSIPLVKPIGTWGEAIYTLTTNPTITANGVSLPLRGVVATKAGVAPPFNPNVTLPNFVNPPMMLELFIGEYVVDSAIYTAYKAGLLTFTVTNSDIPKGSPFHFNTDSFQFIVPELAKKYPNTTMKAVLAPTGQFSAIFGPSAELSFGAIYDAIFYVLPASAPNGIEVFTLQASLAGSVQAALNGTSIKVHISDQASLSLKLVSSTVGTFSTKVLQSLANVALPIVINKIDAVLAVTPIPFPVIPNIAITSAVLDYGVGYAVVSLNVAYSG